MDYTEMFSGVLDTLLEKDDLTIVFIGERSGADIASLREKHGAGRVLVTGNGPAADASLAVGMAMDGMRPVMLLNGRELAEAFYVIACEAAPMYELSGSQFSSSVTLIADMPPAGSAKGRRLPPLADIYTAVPHMRVFCPQSFSRLTEILLQHSGDSGPVLIFSDMAGEAYEAAYEAESLEKPAVTLVGICAPASEIYAAAAEAGALGIGCDIFIQEEMPSGCPAQIASSVSKSGRCIIVHTDRAVNSARAVSTGIMESEAFYYLERPVTRVSLADGAEKEEWKALIYEGILRAVK